MQSSNRERKSKFTASVRERLVELVDGQAAKLNLTRSDIIEQAMEMWLRRQAQLEEEKYFLSAAKEMNEDARDWNTVTGQTLRTDPTQ